MPAPLAMTSRTLPIRLAPIRGESLDSYLEALASRSEVTWGDLLDAVGLGARPAESGTGIYPWVVQLTDAESTALGFSTGVDAATLAAMTLSHLAPATHSGPPVPVLLSPSRSRFCPLCLEDTHGRWQSWWRLRWAFACPQHACLLVDACPECRRWQRVGQLPAWLSPTPGTCARKAVGTRGRALTRCGAALSDHDIVRLHPDDAVVTAQRRLLGYLHSRSVSDRNYQSHPVNVWQFHADVAALATRILHHANPSDLTGRLPPPLVAAYLHHHAQGPTTPKRSAAQSATAVSAAVGVVCALDVLDCTDIGAAGQQLRWLVTRARQRGVAVTASNIGWGKHVSDVLRSIQLSALEPFLGPSDQLRYRCGAARPRRPSPAPVRHHHVPALLWPAAARRFAVDRIGTEPLAAALSAAVLVVGTPTTLSHAATLLGSVTTAASVSRVLQALQADEHWNAMRQAIAGIADAIDSGECRIDYNARRALPFPEFLPEQQWREICSDTATPAGGSVKLRMARAWMYQRVVGSPARSAPGMITANQYRVRIAKFVRSVTPALVERLDLAAQRFLRDHGLPDAPLYHPLGETPALGAGLPWGSLTVDIAELHRLVRNPVLNFTDVAGQLGITFDDVVETLGSHPAPVIFHDDHQRRARGGAFAAAKAQLSRSALVELYVRQGLGLAEIGASTGVSRQIVRRLLDRYDVAVRPAGRRRQAPVAATDTSA